MCTGGNRYLLNYSGRQVTNLVNQVFLILYVLAILQITVLGKQPFCTKYFLCTVKQYTLPFAS